MRFRALALFPLLWGAAFLAASALLEGQPGHGPFVRVEIETVKVLTLVGSWAAAAAFDRGDYLRRAWFLIGLCMALLLLRDVTLFVPMPAAIGLDGVLALRGALVVAANLSQIAGTWMLARAWRIADLSLSVTAHGRRAVLAVTVLLAAIFGAPGLWTNGIRVAGGDLGSVAGVASALGDTVSLVLIGPLLLTALALRGGTLGQVWALLAASYLCWLFYDAALVLAPMAGLGASGVRIASELFRALGCTLGFSAGIAQRAAVLDLRSGSTSRAA
jgi:hypothetical protein